MSLVARPVRKSLLSVGLATEARNIVRMSADHLAMHFQEKQHDKSLKKPSRPNLTIVIAVNAIDWP
jgi:hypothetical protein